MSERYTQEQLEQGFKLVQPKTHWKDPIRKWCKVEEIDLITESVIHFTGTVPNFGDSHVVWNQPWGRFKKGNEICICVADGYRMGPCGDH